MRGVRAIRDLVRARGSIRLQKSTGGARPLAPAGEEPADTSKGLASPCESIWGSEKASEAGSRWQNRGHRWRAPTKPSGLCASEAPQGALVDGRRLGSGKPSSLNAMAVEAILVPREEARVSGYSRGATGGVRGVRRQPCPRSKTPWQWEHRPERCSALLRNERTGCERRGRSSMGAVKRASTRGRATAR